MGRHCFVPKCTSGYKSNKQKISLFSAPKDEVRLKKWRQAIAREDRLLSDKDFVCAKHFTFDYIITEWNDGVNTIPLRHPKLAEGAVPSIFSYGPNSLSKNDNEEPAGPSNMSDIKHPLPPFETVYLNTNSAPVPAPVFGEMINPIKTEIKTEEIQEEDNLYLFNILWNNINLPNEFWSMNKVIKQEKYIIYSKYTTRNGIPVPEKEIMVTADFKIKFFVLHKNWETDMFPNVLSSVEDLEEIIKTFHILKICVGGPSLDDYPRDHFMNKNNENNIDSFQNVWRHRNCSIIILDRNIKKCSFCNVLTNSLRTQKRRISEKQESLDLVTSLRRKTANQRKKLARLNNKVRRMKSVISVLKKQVAEKETADRNVI